MTLFYRIVSASGVPLGGFHPNGGWNIRNVFDADRYNFWIFTTEQEAIEYVNWIREQCEKQRHRWGDWTEVALAYAQKLHVEPYESHVGEIVPLV